MLWTATFLWPGNQSQTCCMGFVDCLVESNPRGPILNYRPASRAETFVLFMQQDDSVFIQLVESGSTLHFHTATPFTAKPRLHSLTKHCQDCAESDRIRYWTIRIVISERTVLATTPSSSLSFLKYLSPFYYPDYLRCRRRHKSVESQPTRRSNNVIGPCSSYHMAPN